MQPVLLLLLCVCVCVSVWSQQEYIFSCVDSKHRPLSSDDFTLCLWCSWWRWEVFLYIYIYNATWHQTQPSSISNENHMRNIPQCQERTKTKPTSKPAWTCLTELFIPLRWDSQGAGPWLCLAQKKEAAIIFNQAALLWGRASAYSPTTQLHKKLI